MWQNYEMGFNIKGKNLKANKGSQSSYALDWLTCPTITILATLGKNFFSDSGKNFRPSRSVRHKFQKAVK